jgi:hypothetical protein
LQGKTLDFNISLKFRPSQWFLGILAELNEQYAGWTDGSYDWAAQTKDFLHNATPPPAFNEEIFKTPLSRRAVNDLLHVSIAMMSGNYPLVRDYMQSIRFAFVIGYPRSGGSYLIKELLRSIGLDHKHVSEALAHDGFPELRDIWYDWNGDRPYFHLQSAVFQAAEFLVISNLWYQKNTSRHPHGHWFSPKKIHKLVNWGGSFKMLLGEGNADYLVTIRNPLPTAISIYEKSGGLPEDRLFPVKAPRSAIEHWIITDLMLLGYKLEEIAAMEYFDAVQVSWSNFHAKMATSGLFLGDRSEIRLLAYSKDTLEDVSRQYRAFNLNLSPAEPFLIHDKAANHPDWAARSLVAVESMTQLWRRMGLTFPTLSLS